MIYYPLSTLMLAGIRDILIITTPHDLRPVPAAARRRRAVGRSALTTRCSRSPTGSPQAFIIGARLRRRRPRRARPGRQYLLRPWLAETLARAPRPRRTAPRSSPIRCSDPERYGVVEFDDARQARLASRRSRKAPKSNWAVTGLYFYDDRRRRHRRATSSPRRAASWRSPTSTGPIWSAGSSRSSCWAAALPGSTPARSTPARGRRVRASHRAAAGPEDRLPGGDRLAHGLHRQGAAARAWRTATPRAATATISGRSRRTRVAGSYGMPEGGLEQAFSDARTRRLEAAIAGLRQQLHLEQRRRQEHAEHCLVARGRAVSPAEPHTAQMIDKNRSKRRSGVPQSKGGRKVSAERVTANLQGRGGRKLEGVLGRIDADRPSAPATVPRCRSCWFSTIRHRSPCAAYDRSRPPWQGGAEVIILDNGSTDETGELLARVSWSTGNPQRRKPILSAGSKSGRRLRNRSMPAPAEQRHRNSAVTASPEP